MDADLSALVGQRMMIALEGKEQLPADVDTLFANLRPGGVTLFRHLNVDTPAQVRRLTGLLQDAARRAGLPPLLIGADQEGGQLMAVGQGVTQLPGNLALGAAGSLELARRAGQVLGRELAALGINVDYAPCSDVNVNPDNPVIGTRSFGEDSLRVADFSAALAAGIQDAGVAATAKHFPGHGDTTSDSHHGVPAVPHGLERLRAVEFPPFRASIQAGVKLVMTAHVALPAVTGRADLPATLSPEILIGLLRGELGFQGVTITDALDMKAIRQGDGLGADSVRAAAAGADLLLMADRRADMERVSGALHAALMDGSLDPAAFQQSLQRIAALKSWLAAQGPQPGLEVINSPEHTALADEIAARSITRVRGACRLDLRPEQRLVVIVPRPADLTPADTSSYVTPALGSALREYHPNVVEISPAYHPDDAEIAAVREQVRGAGAVVIGTINAFAAPAQAALVRQVLTSGVPTVVAALRMPYDLAAFPEASDYLCAYSLLEPSARALARVLIGRAGTPGRLPVSIPGLAPLGSGIG